MERLLRPYAVVIDGRLEYGLELIVAAGRIEDVRALSGSPEPYVVSPAFVNAHSHLEYRGLQGKLFETEYWPWIREITEAKRGQNLEQVRLDCLLAARENRDTGVAVVAEHSDRPFAGEAMASAGLRGVIFQEVITRFEAIGVKERFERSVALAAEQSAKSGLPGYPSPHAYQTVDEETLRWFGASGRPFSMHVAETDLESELTLHGTGAIAETFRRFGVAYRPPGTRLIAVLDALGLLGMDTEHDRDGRENHRRDARATQFVHCCAINEAEISLLAERGVSVAHCPRSNRNLNCPSAPVREMLDAGVRVGLGLDSAASSGPIDMFAEMRCALEVSRERGKPISAEEVWLMATGMGAASLRFAVPAIGNWRIQPGSDVDLIKIHIADARCIEDLIMRGSPEVVEH